MKKRVNSQIIGTRHDKKGLESRIYPQALAGVKLPLEVSVEGADIYTSGDVDALCDVVDVFKWSLDTIEDGPHDPWAQLHRERFPRPEHGIPNGHAGWMQAQERKNSWMGQRDHFCS